MNHSKTTCDNQYLGGSHMTVRGSNNNITGAHCCVFGNDNIVAGAHATVRGNDNLVTGAHARVYGNRNTVCGAHAKTWGRNNRCSGAHSKSKTEIPRNAPVYESDSSSSESDDSSSEEDVPGSNVYLDGWHCPVIQPLYPNRGNVSVGNTGNLIVGRTIVSLGNNPDCKALERYYSTAGAGTVVAIDCPMNDLTIPSDANIAVQGNQLTFTLPSGAVVRIVNASHIPRINGVARADFIAALTASTAVGDEKREDKPSSPFAGIADAKSAELDKDSDEGAACVVCLSNKKTIACQPCGHLCCCPECARKLGEQPKCPMCRKNIVSTSLIFW